MRGHFGGCDRIPQPHRRQTEMPVYQCHEILSAQGVDHHMDYREGGKILLLLKEQHRLFQCVGDAAANLVPELAGRILHIFDLGQQHLVEFADLKLHHMETLRLEGDQLHAVAGNVKNGLCLRTVLCRKRRVELVCKRHRLKLQIHRVEVGVQQRVGPLPHRRGLGIADHHARQVIIFRTDKRVIGDERVFELADIGFQLNPEPGVFGFFAQLGRCHVGEVQLAELDNAAGDDQSGILRGKADLLAKTAKNVADHILLARQVLQVELSWQPD